MSSGSPLAAKLAQIFSLRNCVFAASVVFAVGSLVTSHARTLAAFLLGRAVQGMASAGIMTVSFILVLELSGPERRGLFMGLVNTGFPAGVSIGAVVAGAVLPVAGWVGSAYAVCKCSMLTARRDSSSGSSAPSPWSSARGCSSACRVLWVPGNQTRQRCQYAARLARLTTSMPLLL